MSALIFDADESLASIGNLETITKIFGVPPKTVRGGLTQLSALINSLFTMKLVAEQHPLFDTTDGVPASEALTVYKARGRLGAMGIDTIIIDSLSISGHQERRMLASQADPMKSGHRAMSQPLWGVYGDALWDLGQMLRHLPVTVVCTCHLERETKKVNGEEISRDVMALKGSSKEAIAKLFDVVLYSDVVCEITGSGTEAKAVARYLWQTVPDSGRPYAKDRLRLLPAMMEQDLGLIIKTYRDAGLQHPKILIAGESGSGKTSSLKTAYIDFETCNNERGKTHVPQDSGR